MSCRGWSSDAYWAARVTSELLRLGHDATLGCRKGTEARVIERARREGAQRTVTFRFASGVEPAGDVADVRRLLRLLRDTDVVHVHRGKEHWLAAIANRLSVTPRPIVRTRHIVQPVRPHAANRWLYRRGTNLVVTVTEAIRRQYLASGLVREDAVVALPGGADVEHYRPRRVDDGTRVHLGVQAGETLVGMVGGFRVMKGHAVVVDAAARFAFAGTPVRFAFIGRGTGEPAIRESIQQTGVGKIVTVAGFIDDLAAAMSALDIALYVPLESDGMSRVVFEYLAAGRPVIASRVGVVAEVLEDGVNALLVPAGDAPALAKAIGRLVGDPALRARLGAAGRGLVEARYSGAQVAAALQRHYARLVGAA